MAEKEKPNAAGSGSYVYVDGSDDGREPTMAIPSYVDQKDRDADPNKGSYRGRGAASGINTTLLCQYSRKCSIDSVRRRPLRFFFKYVECHKMPLEKRDLFTSSMYIVTIVVCGKWAKNMASP